MTTKPADRQSIKFTKCLTTEFTTHCPQTIRWFNILSLFYVIDLVVEG
jgi:hypothetical protein